MRRVILGMSSQSLPATNAEQMYVSASRARERVTLYTDDKAAVASAIGRSSRKMAALDLAPKRPELIDVGRMRERMVRRRRVAFFDRLRAAWAAARPRPPLMTQVAKLRRQEQERSTGHER